MSLNLLTQEEKENKNEIVSVTEQVLDAEGIECDSKIAKISEEKMREILNEVRKRRKQKRRLVIGEDNSQGQEEEAPISAIK
jgi:hypothetical protein